MIDCRIRPIASLILPLALIACGGGGGGGSTRDLTVDFNYDPAHAFLFRPASLRLAATGLEGNSPVCAVVGGELPRGLTLQANGCAIVGTPIEVASKSVTIRLTVPGFTGQIEKSIAFLSFGPPTQYPFFENLPTGTPISSIPSSPELPPGISPWTAAPGEAVRYYLMSGTLPEGLVLDPNDGRISGVMVRSEVYKFTIAATVSSGTAIATLASNPRTWIVVMDPALSVFYPPFGTTFILSVGTSIDVAPAIGPPTGRTLSEYTFTNYRVQDASGPLPAGLLIDGITGRISGTPTVRGAAKLLIQVDVSISGQNATFPLKPFDILIQ